MTFREGDVNRDTGGRFDNKPQSAAEATLAPYDATVRYAASASVMHEKFYSERQRLMRDEFPPALEETVRAYYPDARFVTVEAYVADGEQSWDVASIDLADGESITSGSWSDDDDEPLDQFERANEDVRDLLYTGAKDPDDLETAGAEDLGRGMYKFALTPA